MKSAININKNQLSLAGEFAVLSQLAARGFDANLTMGHTKGVDILVSDPLTNKMFKIEVKTTLEKTATETFYGEGRFHYWIMSQKQELIKDNDLYYCFVMVDANIKFRYFIVSNEVVSNYVKDQHDFWLSTREVVNKITSMRKFRLGLESENKYKMPTPLAKVYEDNWDILRSNQSNKKL